MLCLHLSTVHRRLKRLEHACWTQKIVGFWQCWKHSQSDRVSLFEGKRLAWVREEENSNEKALSKLFSLLDDRQTPKKENRGTEDTNRKQTAAKSSHWKLFVSFPSWQCVLLVVTKKDKQLQPVQRQKQKLISWQTNTNQVDKLGGESGRYLLQLKLDTNKKRR